MKKFFKTNIIITICLLITACGQVSQVTPSAIPPIDIATETTTPAPTATSLPSATATTASTPRPEYVPPTLMPTIDPAQLPALLSNAFSIQPLDINGYKARQITGWESGFGGGFCDGYKWLDASHLILYPRVGQDRWGEGGQIINLATQPVIINLETGNFWLPPSNESESPFNCQQLYWSPEFKILITTKSQGVTSSVSTYTYDGKKLASYLGKLSSISPNRRKILMADSTIIDLQTSKQVKLNWNLEYYDSSTLFPPAPSGIWFYWTSDETRIYSCCYFYADLANGTSYYYTESDFLDSHSNPLTYEGLWMYRGEWVLNDKYFLAEWSQVDDGDLRYIPMFDPAKKMIFDMRKKAEVPEDFSNNYNVVSPDGNYVWLEGWNESYLVNLITFKSQHFTYSNPSSYTGVDWSSDSKFAWFQIYDSDTKSTEANILSTSDMKLHLLPFAPPNEAEHPWHPKDNLVVYPARDKNALTFWNAETMSSRELSFKDQESQYKITNLAWNPDGDKLIFITENHILWQVDYPALENLEQIIASADTISSAQWSPDGKSIALVNGTDIYIIDTTK